MTTRLGKVGDLLTGLLYLTLMALPPRPMNRTTELTLTAHRMQMLARLDALNADAHARAARASADLAKHHADRAVRATRVALWVTPVVAGVSAYLGYQVGLWLS